MRTKRADARRRWLPAAAIPGLIFITTVAALAGCSSGTNSGAESGAMSAAAAPAAGAVKAAAGSAAAASGGGPGGIASADRYVAAGQQLIYTAQLTVRAGNVAAAVARATSIVTAAGGYVSAESTRSDPGHPDRATATVTLRIPVAGYPAALGKLTGTALGTRLHLHENAQDVTQQVADVSSRVASAQAAISQLRALLKRAGSVTALLRVQNQIDSQESNLESMLSQQRALNRETAYATVTLTVLGPRQAAAKPKPKPSPPGLAGGLAGGWHAFRVMISWLLTVIGAVAPFAAVAAAIGGIAWWIRRLTLRRRQPTS